MVMVMVMVMVVLFFIRSANELLFDEFEKNSCLQRDRVFLCAFSVWCWCVGVHPYHGSLCPFYHRFSWSFALFLSENERTVCLLVGIVLWMHWTLHMWRCLDVVVLHHRGSHSINACSRTASLSQHFVQE
jgi:hypothetical protein